MFELIGVFVSEPKLFREGVYGSPEFPGRFTFRFVAPIAFNHANQSLNNPLPRNSVSLVQPVLRLQDFQATDGQIRAVVLWIATHQCGNNGSEYARTVDMTRICAFTLNHSTTISSVSRSAPSCSCKSFRFGMGSDQHNPLIMQDKGMIKRLF